MGDRLLAQGKKPSASELNTLMAYTGSSRNGKQTAQYQTWHKNAPAEFKEMADQLNQRK